MTISRPTLLFLACITVACADDPPPVGPDNRATDITIEAGDDQQGFPRRQLADSLRVRVTDASGRPVVGARVVWEPDAQSGEAAPDTSITNTAGVAATAWILGDVAAPTLQARVVGRNLGVELSATATGFIFGCAPLTVTHSPGDLRALSCSASAVGGFNGLLALGFIPVPADIAIHFGSDSLDLRGTDGPVAVTAVLTIESNVPTGEYQLRTYAASGADTSSSIVAVTVR